MDSHFLTDIDIIDFKCFQNFSAKGFKRVNLIGGKNNIGKTAFMEACFINSFSNTVDNLIATLTFVKYMREGINFGARDLEEIERKNFLDFTKHYHAQSNLNSQEFLIIEQDGKKEYQFDINELPKTIINSNEVNIVSEASGSNIDFLGSHGWDNKGLVNTYQVIQKQDKENELNHFIQKFDSSITNFKVIGNKPLCKTYNLYRDLTEFGDGLRHYISIICALYACENGYLFIDEIGNGIHYQQLDRLWEIILTISKETNCQVFATTHSKEMIEYFARVSQKLNEQDVSFTTLVKNKENEIKVLTRDSEMLLDSIEQEREIRGW